ncbi:hydrogen peroxide-inducible genes activator [Kushneria aurantia]|uniref:Hydrogen peroxide-inducible genes activator n=1 Tax=Kushneria aurantia TaxID=504092 RepID=A0ABV6G0Q6_9GAMM|nr:hydrogen peroxide-inducible genes activator [Kushneria aurantia]
MTLTELRYIVTLAHERHFGRAAERCFVSQPTLSVAVKKLEEELGVALFERSKSTVQVTPLGDKIVAQASRVLEQAGAIREMANEGKDQLSSPLRVGAIQTLGPYLFPHLIPELAREAPQMPLYIEENLTDQLRRKLRSGELDVILVALPFNEPDVLTKALYEEPFEVLLPADHPWLAYDEIDPNAVDDEKMLMLGEGHCFRDQVLEACPTIKEHMQQPGSPMVAEGGSLETIRHMVASKLGISVVPQSAVGTGYYVSGLLETRPFRAPSPSRNIALAWRASFPRPRAIDALTRAIYACRRASQPEAEAG